MIKCAGGQDAGTCREWASSVSPSVFGGAESLGTAMAAEEDVADPSGPAGSARRRPWVHMLTVFITIAGLLLTSGLALAARAVHEDNEERLLQQRTREAAAVLTVAIPTIEGPLASASVLAQATNGQDNAAFRRLLGPLTGTGRGQTFVHTSIWRLAGGTFQPVTSFGAPSRLSQASAIARERFLGESTTDAK